MKPPHARLALYYPLPIAYGTDSRLFPPTAGGGDDPAAAAAAGISNPYCWVHTTLGRSFRNERVCSCVRNVSHVGCKLLNKMA